MNKVLQYLCIAAAGGCKTVTINGKTYILPKDRKAEFRFTGNLYNRYPCLRDFAPLSDKSRLRLILSPIQASWFFEFEGKPFNFFPLFLFWEHLNRGTDYIPAEQLLTPQKAAEIASNYKL